VTPYPRIALTGGPVEYQLWEPAEEQAPTLVLLHEGLGSIAQWKDFPQRLAQASGCRVLAYSRYGYGGSGPVPLPRPLDYLHREAVGPLPELLAALGIGRHVLVGHSDGGTIALLNAALSPAPTLLGVVAEAPHVFVEDMTVAGIARALEQYRADDHGKSLRQRLARYHGGNVDVAFHGWASAWLHPDFRTWDIGAEISGIRVPVLLVQGRQDEYATLAQLDRIEHCLSGRVERLVIEECGHSPHLRHPGPVAGAVTAFVSGLL
jgi:pimeloyl-ACP methyl ester carboxylesterase